MEKSGMKVKQIKVMYEKNGIVFEREYGNIVNWNLEEENKDDYTYYNLNVEGLKIKGQD